MVILGYGFKVSVKGDYALFSRPELKVERVSYDCITPSAARGLLEAVFWKPAIKYVIDEIVVVNKIKFDNIRRNEVKSKINARDVRTYINNGGDPPFISTKDSIQQRASMLLKDVHYIISAHFELTDKVGESDTPEKFYNMILRRLKKGQCFHQPYLGCREFPAKVELVEENQEIKSQLTQEQSLGLMLYDMDFSDKEHIKPTYFQAVLKNGVLDLRDVEVLR